jgi:ferredoxin
MEQNGIVLETIRAAIAPHGLFVRGSIDCGDDGPFLTDGRRARSVVLIGNIGSSLWMDFSTWRMASPDRGGADPLDRWSVETVGPLAARLGATAYFPSEKPWQPFQHWAMQAEGLKASPLGILIHPIYGLWHGYRAALGFCECLPHDRAMVHAHPCDACLDKPCLSTCPVGAISCKGFDVAGCRDHLRTPQGQAGCMRLGCIAHNACPVGAEFRYETGQLRFHMAALG